MKISVYILILLLSIRLDTIVYVVNNLCIRVLLKMNILIKKETNIDLKQKKLTIDYRKADLIFKTF